MTPDQSPSPAILAHAVAGVVLAGGQSRRMGGGDKCLLPLADATMLDFVLTRLRPHVGPVALNANGDPSRFSSYALPVVADPVQGFAGPLAGVLAGLRWAADTGLKVTHIGTAPGDAPFLPKDYVPRLWSALAEVTDPERAIVLAQSGGRLHPVAGLWPVALADALEQALHDGVRKVLAWTDRHAQLAVTFPPVTIGDTDVDPFFNANTPEELAEASALLIAAKGASK